MNLFDFAECALQAHATENNLVIDKDSLIKLKSIFDRVQKLVNCGLINVSTISIAHLPYCELSIVNNHTPYSLFLENVATVKESVLLAGGECTKADNGCIIVRFKVEMSAT